MAVTNLSGFEQELARQIKAQRAYLVLSQEEAAFTIGVSLRTFQGWEAGRSFPQPRHRRALEKFLRLEPE